MLSCNHGKMLHDQGSQARTETSNFLISLLWNSFVTYQIFREDWCHYGMFHLILTVNQTITDSMMLQLPYQIIPNMNIHVYMYYHLIDVKRIDYMCIDGC